MLNKILFVLIILSLSPSVFAQKKKTSGSNPKVEYRYKEFEKFDFDDLAVEGDTSNPGDISISPRFQKEYKNKLPEKENFNSEIKRDLESIL